jgi:hypothetical protein
VTIPATAQTIDYSVQDRAEFLRMLHPDGWHDVRALDLSVEPSRVVHSGLIRADDLAAVERWVANHARWHLYVGVAARDGRGHKAENCLPLRVVWVDLDFKDAPEDEMRRRLAAFPIPPSFVIRSGGGLHVYWRLDEPLLPDARARALLRSLALELGGDMRAAEVARILRIPGTLNHKYDPPRPVEVDTIDVERFCSVGQLLAALAPLVVHDEKVERSAINHDFSVQQRQQRAAEWLATQKPAIEGQHGDQRTFVVCAAVARGFDLPKDDEAAVALREWNARCQPPWSHQGLRKKIRNACEYGDEQIGGRLVRRRVNIEDLQTFLQRIDEQPEPSWLIPGLIPDEGICLWHGQPRDFKTFCAQEGALALATGRPAFHNPRFAVPRKVKVAYFTEEDPERLFAARMHWLIKGSSMPDANFFFPFIRRSLSFDNDDDQLYILCRLRETGAEVAAIDPIRSFTGLSDKGPADLRPVAKFLRQIQNETRAKTLLLVHHDTKPLPINGEENRSRSQRASGGGIFSISDCPVAFEKLDWNKVAVYPEDYKLSGNPKPFEVTFETDEQRGDDGPRFGSWVRPIATSKGERDIKDGTTATKILQFLESQPGEWFATADVRERAKLRHEDAGRVLEALHAEGEVRHCTGDEAKALGRSRRAKLWSAGL